MNHKLSKKMNIFDLMKKVAKKLHAKTKSYLLNIQWTCDKRQLVRQELVCLVTFWGAVGHI